MAEIREVHGPGPFTLVFDRGGFSADACRFLQAEGIGFITYLKGRPPRRRVPADRFQRSWFTVEGTRQVYRVFEKPTRIRRVGTFRTILFLGDQDRQVPVLTNLNGPSTPAKIVHCLQLRWRQENSFKFLHQHYAIEQIIQYGADPETQPRQVLNPKRKTLSERVRAVTEDMHTLEAELGRAIDASAPDRRTLRGLPRAHRGLRRQLATRRQALARLQQRLRHTPRLIDAADAGKTRWILREDRRLVVNTLKLVAANAERLLVRDFLRYYTSPKDAFSIVRGLFQLPGTVRAMDADRLEVSLRRPDSAKVAQALDALLGDLNREQPRFLGDGPTLHFTLADPLSENGAAAGSLI